MDLFIHVAKAATEEATNTGVVGLFGLNFKLFLAQLINFGVICFVLWKWVFTPLNKRLQDRSKEIEDSINTAEEIKEQKKQFENWRAGQMEEARNEAGQILAKAKQEAEDLKTSILEKGKLEQSNQLSKALSEIESAKKRAVAEVKTELADMVVDATKKILGEKMDSKKDKEMIAKSLERLEHDN